MNYTTDKNATSVRILQGVLTVEENAKQVNVTDGKDDDTYDYVGAMHFVVATVLVYSILGVFCVLLSRMKRLRGRHFENYVNDESISKYLKKERTLKLDGRKMKLMYECELVSQRVKQFEERQMLLNLEKDLLENFKIESPGERKQKRKGRKKKRDIGNTLGLMGASLFYIDSNSGSYTSLDSQYLPPVAEDIETDAADDKYEHAYVTRQRNDDDNVDGKHEDIFHNGNHTDLLLNETTLGLNGNTDTAKERKMLVNVARAAKSVAEKDLPLITDLDSLIPGITIFDENGEKISDTYKPS